MVCLGPIYFIFTMRDAIASKEGPTEKRTHQAVSALHAMAALA